MCKKKLTRILCLFLCVLTIFSSIWGTCVFSADDNDDTYFYTNDEDGESIKNLYSLTVYDILDGARALNWALSTDTFIVVKQYKSENKLTGAIEDKTKVYVNVPNIQQYVQNLVLGFLADGWDVEMYTPSSEVRSSIGELKYDDNGQVVETPTNVLDKFGYSISTPAYKGEYPRILMSVSEILPTGFLQTAWRALKSLFGFSIIEAPGASTFQTLYYYNNGYFSDSNERLIQFIQKSWPLLTENANQGEYAINQGEYAYPGLIPTGKLKNVTSFAFGAFSRLFGSGNEDRPYFDSPKETEKMAVTLDEKNAAEEWLANEENIKAYHEARQAQAKRLWWEYYCDSSESIYAGSSNAMNYGGEVVKYVESDGVLISLTSGKMPEDWEYYDKQGVIDQSYLDAKEQYRQYLNQDVDQLLEDAGWSKEKKLLPQIEVNNDTMTVYTDKEWITVYKDSDGNIKSLNDLPGYTPASSKPNWKTYRDSKYPEEDYPKLTEEQESVIEKWLKNVKIIEDYEKFILWMNYGTAHFKQSYSNWSPLNWFSEGHTENIYYSQCLLNTESKKDELTDEELTKAEIDRNKTSCSKTYGGKEISATIYDFFIRTNLYDYKYTATKTYNDGNGHEWKILDRQDAINIIAKLQQTFGPAYEEAMSNFIVVVKTAAEKRGYKVTSYEQDDPRIMPYDINTLSLKKDRETITISDPRVELYKQTNFIGGYITANRLNLFTGLSNSAYSKLISFAGKLTAIACTLDSFCSFDWLDNIAEGGLKPTEIWTSISASSIIMVLGIFLMIEIIRSTIGYLKGSGALAQLIGKVILFIFCLAIIFLITNSSETTYATIKNVSNKIWNLASREVIEADENMAELYGPSDNKEATVTYYLPYFNLWTYYMTGYPLGESTQIINDNQPESEQMIYPRYGNIETGNKTKLWPVVLADSFNTQGINQYVVNTSSGGTNGEYLNHNAYRVVDHFMAPRLEIDRDKLIFKNKKLKKEKLGLINDAITNSPNENYNGQFQNPNLWVMIGLLLNNLEVMILAVAKFLVFLWFWYCLYTFVFNILLSASSIDTKSIQLILVKTFLPILFIAFIDLYAGVIIKVSMSVVGPFILVFNLLLLVINANILNIWKRSQFFPATLKPLCLVMSPLLTIANIKMRVAERRYNDAMDGSEIERDEEGKIKPESVLTDDGKWRYPNLILQEKAFQNQIIHELKYEPHRRDSYTPAMEIYIRDMGLDAVVEDGYDSIEKKQKAEEKQKRKEKRKAQRRRMVDPYYEYKGEEENE